MNRVAVLISGTGRNLQALLDAAAAGRLPVTWAGVLSNRADAPGLARARAAGVPTAVIDHRQYSTREAFDAAVMAQLAIWAVDWVVLAGFMRILTPAFTRHYAGRLLNIHPSLLPRHPGLHTHQRVLDAGDTEHGATVHFVTADLDGGPPIIQGKFTVGAEDDARSLAQRVMDTIEVRIYPQAVAWCVSGELRLTPDGKTWFRGGVLEAPLGLDALTPAFRECR